MSVCFSFLDLKRRIIIAPSLMAVMRTKWHNTYEHLAQSLVHFKPSVNLSYYFDDDYHHLSFHPPQKERQQMPLGGGLYQNWCYGGTPMYLCNSNHANGDAYVRLPTFATLQVCSLCLNCPGPVPACQLNPRGSPGYCNFPSEAPEALLCLPAVDFVLHWSLRF